MPKGGLKPKKKKDFTTLPNDILLHIYSFNFPVVKKVHTMPQIQQFVESWRSTIVPMTSINKSSHKAISTKIQVDILRQCGKQHDLADVFEKIERPINRAVTEVFYTNWVDLLTLPVYWPMQVYKPWGLPAHVLELITFKHFIFNNKPFYGIKRNDLIIALSTALGPVPPRSFKALRF